MFYLCLASLIWLVGAVCVLAWILTADDGDLYPEDRFEWLGALVVASGWFVLIPVILFFRIRYGWRDRF